jgi:hypothetical protein
LAANPAFRCTGCHRTGPYALTRADSNRQDEHVAEHAHFSLCLLSGNEQQIERIPQANPSYDEEHTVSEQFVRKLAHHRTSEKIRQPDAGNEQQ